ncbi:hypothetical protein EMCRGX_G018166 [Ephydatia muelleri]
MFLSGDYEFLSALYGLSVASGKQQCLWCLVTLDDLEGSCSLRGPFPARTVELMYDDYKRFIASGGDNNKVKFFNNCKGFPIPLNQVCLPACTTHINGNLYSLLDEECHLLDLKLALQLSTDAELTTASYEEYATAVRELTAYKEQLGVLRQEHCSLMDLINYSAIIVRESSPLLSSLIEEYANYSSKIAKLVTRQKYTLSTLPLKTITGSQTTTLGALQHDSQFDIRLEELATSDTVREFKAVIFMDSTLVNLGEFIKLVTPMTRASTDGQPLLNE